jgi:hypothetical protein
MLTLIYFISLVIYRLHDFIKQIGRACSMHGRDEKCIYNLSENLKGRYDAEDLGIDGKILRVDLREIWWEGVARFN